MSPVASFTPIGDRSFALERWPQHSTATTWSARWAASPQPVAISTLLFLRVGKVQGPAAIAAYVMIGEDVAEHSRLVDMGLPDERLGGRDVVLGQRGSARGELNCGPRR